jgi:SAM-dependent methyltransferase
MYELIVYQLTRGRQNLTRRYLEIAGAHKKSSKSAPYKVLCLGDGIGVDTLVFLKHGFDVTYFEFTCKSFDFAKILWEENGVKPAVINNLSEIPHNAFDVVISSDVLEHVQDPPDVIRHISLYLRDEGLAFVLASYPAIVPNLATHLFANLDFWGRSIELFRKNKMVITADSDPKGSPHVFQKFENESVLRRKVRQSYLNKATLEVRMQEWFTKYIRSKRLANKSRDMIQSPDYLKGVVSENESPLLDLN